LIVPSIYNDFQDDVLTEKEYEYIRQKHENENGELNTRLNEISTELKKYAEDFVSANKSSAEMRRFTNMDELSREMLTASVEKIIIHDKNTIEA
jgi:hypothetical protein